MSRCVLGLSIPRRSLRQADTAAAARPCHHVGPRRAAVLDALYERTTVLRRGCALLADGGASMGDVFPPARSADDAGPGITERMRRYHDAAVPLAVRACRNALRHAGTPASTIRHLVTVSCTGFAAPGVDLALIDALRLDAGVTRTNVGFMGCHGALNGWRVADALVRTSGENVLLCCTEVCTTHFQYGWAPRSLVANALFADGAAAGVLAADPTTAEPGLRLRDQASTVIPGTTEAMSWTLSEHGFVMRVSSRVPALIRAHLPDWLQAWLAGHGLKPNDIDGWAIHPGGPRVMDAVEDALTLPKNALDASRRVLRRHGNLSSPTVLFILDRLRRTRKPGPWVALAFGPGLTVEAALIDPVP